MGLSRPVAFQNPAAVARFVLVPVGYFLSLWLKKYHSFCSSSAAPPFIRQRSVAPYRSHGSIL
uniref:Uncharacterized protein n=1 Tax=Leersia perrieri TaxID=77586 RepID=A0A0D9WKT9_9ORYZ